MGVAFVERWIGEWARSKRIARSGFGVESSES
jgi:hypothetical protein